MKNTLKISIIFILLSISFSCNKTYDNPPINEVPIGNIISISDLKDMFTGLKCIQGKGVVNSISLKEGEAQFIKHGMIKNRLGSPLGTSSIMNHWMSSCNFF